MALAVQQGVLFLTAATRLSLCLLALFVLLRRRVFRSADLVGIAPTVRVRRTVRCRNVCALQMATAAPVGGPAATANTQGNTAFQRWCYGAHNSSPSYDTLTLQPRRRGVDMNDWLHVPRECYSILDEPLYLKPERQVRDHLLSGDPQRLPPVRRATSNVHANASQQQ